MQAISIAKEEKAFQSDLNSLPPGHTKDGSTTYDVATFTMLKINPENEVRFEEQDALNPLCWPLWRKWVIIILVSVTLMIDTFATTTIVPAAPQILAEFGETNDLYLVLLVSIWELGEGIGPFLYAPLAEMYGRMPVYHMGNVLFVLALTASALSTNLSMLIAFRFISGFVTTSLTLGPAIVGDLFEQDQRGMVMAVNIVLPILGPVAAPVVGSYTARTKGWRWTIWIVVIAAGALTLLSFLIFRETYKVKILEKKTRRLRKATGNANLVSHLQHHVDKVTFVESLTRPIAMLLLSPPILIVSIYTALVYGANYLIFTTLAEVMERNYDFKQGPVGLAYLANTIGGMIGMVFYGLLSDRYLKYRRRKGKPTRPEHRLVLMLWGAIILPFGFCLYGWTAQFRVQWIAPLMGTGIVGFSLVLAMLPTENYLVDIHDLYAASAIAAGVILRALFGALFPLFSSPLYGHLNLGWGNSILGFVTAGFVPVIVLLIRQGDRLRNASRVKESVAGNGAIEL